MAMQPGAPDGGPPDPERARARHDMKNHLTALRSGCLLLQRHLQSGELELVRSYLEEMQEEVRRGFETLERLR